MSSSHSASLLGRSVLSVDQFSRSDLETVFAVATQARQVVQSKGSCDACRGKILANAFYEPSTRTMCSFAAAMYRLGGNVLAINSTTSSVKKGETLADTVRSLECYSDIVVLRHPIKGSAAEAAAALQCPLLNAGDGVGEHPTQALLDAYTIVSECGKIDGLTVTLVGDLKHGRTVHSLAKMLGRLYKVSFVFVSPEQLRMPREVVQQLPAECTVRECNSLDDAVAESDVIYVTRVQKERFESEAAYNAVQGCYVVSAATMLNAKPSCCVMHPLPRVGEIATEVDADPRAAYFRQMKNGMFVRMALISLVLGCPIAS